MAVAETPGETSYEVLIAGLQARLPGNGTGVSDPRPNGALARINREHAAYPGAINAPGKHWTYALAALGQVDATVVADTPSYGVFCRGGTDDGCQGGTRTYVAYMAMRRWSCGVLGVSSSVDFQTPFQRSNRLDWPWTSGLH